MFVGASEEAVTFTKELRPTFHVFHEERLRWLEFADDLPRHATVTGRVDGE